MTEDLTIALIGWTAPMTAIVVGAVLNWRLSQRAHDTTKLFQHNVNIQHVEMLGQIKMLKKELIDLKIQLLSKE